MAEPTFQQKNAGDPLYLLKYGPTAVDTVAYLPDHSPEQPITLTQSWQTILGKYLFFSEAVADQADFVNNLRQYLNSPARLNDRFLWITHPNESLAGWVVETLAVQNNATVGANTFTFSSYLLWLGGNCLITLQQTGEVYAFQMTPVRPTDQVFFFETDFGANRYPLPGPTISLSFEPGSPGSFQFDLALQADSSTRPDFNSMDVGLRFYIDYPDYADYLQSLRYPLFVTPATAINLHANLAPAHHLDGAKTFFRLTKSGLTPPVIETHYLTNTGQVMNLAPTGTARLVFSLKPRMKIASPGDAYTLVPGGDFDILVPGSGGKAAADEPLNRVMCGISGVEYVGLMSESGNQMHFFPGQNAYAPNFQPPNTPVTGRQPVPVQGLADLATTAWAYLTPPSGQKIHYFAQPEGSILYQGGNSGSLAQYLNYLEMQANTLCPDTGEITSDCAANGESEKTLTAFPMAPYTAIPPGELDTYRLLELQVLSPTRRNLIKKLAEAPTTDKTGNVTGATPQGLVVDLNAKKTYWKALTVARTVNHADAAAPHQPLQFTDITGEFKAALQSNQLFLVVNNPAVFQSCASVNYKLTRLALAELADQAKGNVPAAVLHKLTQSPGMGGALYADQTAFAQALQQRLTAAELSQYQNVLLKYCAFAFLVIGEQGHYDLATEDLQAIESGSAAPQNLIDQLKSSAVVNTKYDTLAGYQAALAGVIGQNNWDAYANVWLEYGYVRADGWQFNLSPWFWDEHGTIMILKYAGKSLAELVADTSTWVWPAAADSAGLINTQTTILDMISQAREKAPTEPDFQNFVKKVTDPYWNGILFLKVKVPLDSLPPELQGLAAGVNPARFYGHHLGINVTPVENHSGVLELKDTSLFGLIYYDDSQDQYFEDEPYAFKVLSLKILFQNSAVSNFFSQIELMINQLFGEEAILDIPDHGNNLILNGIYQKHDGHNSYVFLEDETNAFAMQSFVLNEVVINHAQFITVIPPDGLDPGATVQTKFILSGIIRFEALPNFDVFSFGYRDDEDADVAKGLFFSNLTIHMNFPPEAPSQKTFTFDAANLSFDLSRSKARVASFYNHFPLKLNGLIQSAGAATPGDMGFISAVSPLPQGRLESNWYGFTYKLDLGTLGSLTSDVGFVVEVFAGWAPEEADYNVYIGVKLPGSKSAAAEIPIEGVLKMVFKKIEFTANPTPANPATGRAAGVAYMLKFRSIALSLLGFQFPPGQVDMYIFGNPRGNRSALGWYAAYAKDE